MTQRRGFTLLEVMVALALLGLALTVLMKSAAGSIFNAEQAHMMGIATDLARGKMYDIEEKLIKDGFTDTDQSQTDSKGFDDEGWPTIRYSYKVEAVEMPAWDELQQLAQGHQKAKLLGSAQGSSFAQAVAAGSAYGSDYQGLGSDSLNGFQNSALGGMLGMMGAFGGGGGGNTSGLGSAKDVTGSQGGALIQAQYSMFQQILKVSVRKVSLIVTYKVLGSDRDLKLVAFFTDPQAMDTVLNGLGAIDLGDTSNGSAGSGSAVVRTPTPAAKTP